MRPIALTVTALSILIGTGCIPQITDENAAEVYAEVNCAKHRSCDTATWDDFENDMDECVDTIGDGFELLKDGLDLFGFELDHDEVRNCLKDTRAATCEEFEAGDVGNDCDDLFEF